MRRNSIEAKHNIFGDLMNDTQVQDALKLVERLKSNLNSVQSFQKTTLYLSRARKDVKELEDFLNTILEES